MLASDIHAADWPPTRAEGLRRLAEFAPNAGRRYADRRNYDLGPDDRRNVSTLSPYLRHRLVTEEEVVAAALDANGWAAAEKFVYETCWRTYWKGWLELRPTVWSDYRAGVDARVADLDRDPSLRGRFEGAISGRSGIGCVDAWARELIEVGYLHNHARMWFASIWIFTLRLPWELGADFFLRHLIDGDPASNTLSWRWVAGLQTRGKTYLAGRENVAKFTEGRIRPREPLADRADALDGPAPPPIRPLPKPGRLDAGRPFALLLAEDDLDAESLDLRGGAPVAVAGVHATEGRSPWAVGPVVLGFAEGAVADALRRAGGAFECPTTRLADADWCASVVDWAASLGVEQVATPVAPVGPARERLDDLDEALAASGRSLVRLRRRWDDELWPHATSGFFGFKKTLDRSLADLGLVRPNRRR